MGWLAGFGMSVAVLIVWLGTTVLQPSVSFDAGSVRCGTVLSVFLGSSTAVDGCAAAARDGLLGTVFVAAAFAVTAVAALVVRRSAATRPAVRATVYVLAGTLWPLLLLFFALVFLA